MKQLIALSLIVTLSAFTGAPVSAKPLAKILRESGISPSDFEMMQNTARVLYDTANPSAGKRLSWSNADSGAHGMVRLASVHNNCAYIQHFVYAKDAKKPRELRTPYCKNADGKWLLQP